MYSGETAPNDLNLELRMNGRPGIIEADDALLVVEKRMVPEVKNLVLIRLHGTTSQRFLEKKYNLHTTVQTYTI